MVIRVVEYPGESWKQEQLIGALKGKDVLLKMGAIRVLQGRPKDEYVASLMDALNDSDRLVRLNAAITLGRARNPIAIPAIVYHAVSDTDRDVRLYALWAYRQIEYTRASPYLVSVLLESSDPAMIRFAANEIRQKNDSKAIETLIQRFQSKGLYTGYDLDMAAINGLYEIGYVTVEPLVKCLDSEDTRVRANAIYTLGKIGDERAIQPLINHLPAASLEMRSRISDALIKIGRASIPALIKLLDNNDREIKWIAAYSLARIGPDAEASLLTALSQRGAQASEEIIYALGFAGKKDSFAPLYDIYATTPDDSVKAWATIAIASILANNYYDLEDRTFADLFLTDLGEQLKPHMLLSFDTLHALGKIYITRGFTQGPEAFKTNVELGVKCFDLSLIEKDSAAARAFRLFYGSYVKLMTSKSSEIMNYIERDVTDLKKEAERSSNKKEIVYLMDKLLKVLKGAYEDRGFDFVANFRAYSEQCARMEPFLDDFYLGDDLKKAKEQTTLHADVSLIQDKIGALLKAYEKQNDSESAALAYRLSTEVARLDTGVYDDYRVVESCLKNMVTRMKLSNEEKSDLYFKILLVSKNGVSQVQLVLDQMLKGARAEPVEKLPAVVEARNAGGRKVSTLEYIAIAVIVLALTIFIVLGLNKLGVIRLPFTLPISWLNPGVADILWGVL